MYKWPISENHVGASAPFALWHPEVCPSSTIKNNSNSSHYSRSTDTLYTTLGLQTRHPTDELPIAELFILIYHTIGIITATTHQLYNAFPSNSGMLNKTGFEDT